MFTRLKISMNKRPNFKFQYFFLIKTGAIFWKADVQQSNIEKSFPDF